MPFILNSDSDQKKISLLPFLNSCGCSYSAIHKAAGLTVPGRSMICLVLFHHSTIPTVKPSIGEQPPGGVPTSSFFFGEQPLTKEPVAL